MMNVFYRIAWLDGIVTVVYLMCWLMVYYGQEPLHGSASDTT